MTIKDLLTSSNLKQIIHLKLVIVIALKVLIPSKSVTVFSLYILTWVLEVGGSLPALSEMKNDLSK